jgi:hypothetical protein
MIVRNRRDRIIGRSETGVRRFSCRRKPKNIDDVEEIRKYVARRWPGSVLAKILDKLFDWE